MESQASQKARGRSKTKVRELQSNGHKGSSTNRERRRHEHFNLAIKNRIIEFHKNDVGSRNKTFRLHNNGIKIIYGNTRSYLSDYRKKEYLAMNAYVEEADLILISESGFVDGETV